MMTKEQAKKGLTHYVLVGSIIGCVIAALLWWSFFPLVKTNVPQINAKVECPAVVQQEERKYNPVMSNDEIIAETKKCEAAGMKALTRFWAVKKGDNGLDGIADVICLPKYQND